MDRYTYTVCGDALCKREDDAGEELVEVTDSRRLEALDGTEDDSDFSEYWDGRGLEEVIKAHHPESRPRLLFRYDKEANQLMAETAYSFTRRLTEEEMRALEDYTTGQWSDGIGESFEQQPVGDGFYISPWHRGQKLEVIEVPSREPPPGPVQGVSLDF